MVRQVVTSESKGRHGGMGPRGMRLRTRCWRRRVTHTADSGGLSDDGALRMCWCRAVVVCHHHVCRAAECLTKHRSARDFRAPTSPCSELIPVRSVRQERRAGGFCKAKFGAQSLRALGAGHVQTRGGNSRRTAASTRIALHTTPKMESCSHQLYKALQLRPRALAPPADRPWLISPSPWSKVGPGLRPAAAETNPSCHVHCVVEESEPRASPRCFVMRNLAQAQMRPQPALQHMLTSRSLVLVHLRCICRKQRSKGRSEQTISPPSRRHSRQNYSARGSCSDFDALGQSQAGSVYWSPRERQRA